ncbi:YceI family protein [Helicobacter japonicus]|uniref:YceI family protein n=1 Tax=Helicobacter japonicus TaxID=425400 RepID=A0A4U8TUY8_9HELI|nr:YceI family protein [Helicobacter japonicus]TLE02878.1 YceI family protein [Helicobacter japonicus]
MFRQNTRHKGYMQGGFEKLLYSLIFGILLISISTTQAYSAPSQSNGAFTIKQDSHIGFKATKFGFISVDGVFKDFSGDLKLDNDNILSLRGEVKAASVFTDNKKRDTHLLESDFLDVNLYPTSHFVMTRYEMVDNTNKDSIKGKIYGELSLHGTTLPIVLNSLLNLNTLELTLEGEINIKNFGIIGSKMNSDTIELHIKTLWK